jgi:hypothetical protein
VIFAPLEVFAQIVLFGMFHVQLELGMIVSVNLNAYHVLLDITAHLVPIHWTLELVLQVHIVLKALMILTDICVQLVLLEM